MTDKEQFDIAKKDRQIRRMKIRNLNYLRRSTEMQLMVSTDETSYSENMIKLKEIELVLYKEKRNKFSSEFYSFEPSKEIFNRKDKNRLNKE